MIIPFDLPPPAGFSDSPKWNGHNFEFGDQYNEVLEYSENFSGWSDDLTALHEEAAGDSHPIDLASRKDALAQVKLHLTTADTVIMEIGCSSGFLIRDLVKSFPDAIVIGVDVVKEPLYRLARNLPGVPLIRFDLLQCTLPDQSVDILVMLNVLEHIEDDVAALKNAFKLLKPGGSLVIEVPAGPYLYDTYDAELLHFRRYSAKELRDKLIKSGFQVSRMSHLGFLLFPLFAAIKIANKIRSIGCGKKNVKQHVSNSSSNILVRWLIEFESKYGSSFQLPFGIRVLMSAKRPI